MKAHEGEGEDADRLTLSADISLADQVVYLTRTGMIFVQIGDLSMVSLCSLQDKSARREHWE